MKNNITNFALVLVAFVAINLLMSFARPIPADEPKQYIIIKSAGSTEKLEQEINQKLSEGWHLQGGVAYNGAMAQALAK